MTGKILIAPSTFGAVDKAPVERLRQAGAHIVQNPYKRKLTKEELHSLLPGVIGLIAGLEPLTRDVLEKSQLKVISRCGVGLSNVDLQAAADLGIAVRSTPDAPTTAVAELTIGAMLTLLRMVGRMDRDLHDGIWNKRIGTQLEGRTVVIIGFGRIGQKVASLLAPFNVKIIAVDPCRTECSSVQVLPLHEALRHADIVTAHCSGETCILGEKEFELLKLGAFVLNAARGGLIDEKALLKSLDDGRVAGAWFDSFDEEPYGGPLTKYPQVILTPHVGSYTQECRARMELEAVDNLLAALRAG
jgi:D-3-phosphoglycerate dehydrogenase